MQWGVIAGVLVWSFVSGVTCDDSGLREMYKKLVTAKNKLRSGLNEDTDDCSGTPEESRGWIYLHKLFEDHAGGGGVLREVWPRWSFYEPLLNEVLNKSLDGVALCPWEMSWDNERKEWVGSESRKVCVPQQKLCYVCPLVVASEAEELKNVSSILKEICKEGPRSPKKGEFKAERLEEAKGLIGKPTGGSPGPLTPEEAIGWSGSFVEGEGTECGASPRMSLSGKYLKTLVLTRSVWVGDGEITEGNEFVGDELESHPEFYAEKLKWLKGADKSRVMCGGSLVCGWDGVCVPCWKITKETAGTELAEACDLERIDFWEKRTTTTTSEPTTAKQ